MAELVDILGRQDGCRATTENLWNLISWHKTAERMAESTRRSCKTWSPKNRPGLIGSILIRLVVTIGSVCVWLCSCFITCDLVLYKQLFDDTDYRQCVLTLTGSGIVLLSWVESWQLLLSAKRCTHLQHPLWSNTGNYFVSCFFGYFFIFSGNDVKSSLYSAV